MGRTLFGAFLFPGVILFLKYFDQVLMSTECQRRQIFHRKIPDIPGIISRDHLSPVNGHVKTHNYYITPDAIQAWADTDKIENIAVQVRFLFQFTEYPLLRRFTQL